MQELQSIPDDLRNFDHLPDSAGVRQPVVEALFNCSGATVWRRVKDGRIPKPDKFSPRITTWNVGRLRGVLNKRVGEPPPDTPPAPVASPRSRTRLTRGHKPAALEPA